MYNNAFITGASSGLGLALSKRLSRQGTRVILAARRESELRSAAESIRADGGQAQVCVLDVSQPEAVFESIRWWDQQTGGFDLVIANAGVGRTKAAYRLDWKDVSAVLQVNVMGAFATLFAGMECMLKRKRGTLVGISSLAGMRGLPKTGAYSASKAALGTFLETLRADLASQGIRVVDVRPGFIDTAMTKGNRFKMPFLLDVERAAEMTLQGIHRGMPVVSYPWPVASTMYLARSIPDLAWGVIARRMRY
ncbi:MAG: putative oxidoreductase [Deltaproteobacteria bacterium ADurb.Bin207]|nr:MAG: putative oxidoreductase [Deltaproteobacteria bacterium ADurb.Bin207]